MEPLKKEIKKFFNLIIDVLSKIPLSKVRRDRRAEWFKLSCLAKDKKSKETLYSIPITNSALPYNNNPFFLEKFNQKEYLPCFKIAMKYSLLNNDKNVFFGCFYSLYQYLNRIQQELKNFLEFKIDENENQQLLKDLQNNQKTIDNFLNCR